MPKLPSHPDAARGALAATSGFLFWGLVPVYWKQMQSIPAFELIAHRMVWSLVFLLGVIAWQGNFPALRDAFRSKRLVGLNLLSSALLTANWTIYVWAVNSGHVIESSLGYFLVPLANVTFGSLLFHERLRPLQWVAIGCAAAGVGLLLVRLGHAPWIALTIAVTWAGYGLLKKKSALGAITGLTVETLLLFPLAAAALLWWHHTGEGALGRVDVRLHVYVLSVGVITALPLLMFAYGAQRVRLTTLGLLQYLAPSVQFLIGYFFYHEPFDAVRLQAFAVIWCGLAIYSADGFWVQRHSLLRAAGAT
ncbi:MAG: EamA family transporter RarD [Lacunisphaera sp.]|nr:EamA family transporter RarD [Lacunisphaera sp.]